LRSTVGQLHFGSDLLFVKNSELIHRQRDRHLAVVCNAAKIFKFQFGGGKERTQPPWQKRLCTPLTASVWQENLKNHTRGMMWIRRFRQTATMSEVTIFKLKSNPHSQIYDRVKTGLRMTEDPNNQNKTGDTLAIMTSQRRTPRGKGASVNVYSSKRQSARCRGCLRCW